MKKISIISLFLLTLAAYLLFNAGIAVTDPVESNYALTAKEMLLSGDLLSPRIYGHYWYDKPAMIYWLIAGCYKIFGINEFAARFPAAIFSALSVTLTYWFALEIYHNRRIAWLSALALATSLEFWLLSKMIITDAILFFFFSLVLVSFYLGVTRREKQWYMLAGAAAGFAVLTKGPVGLALPGLVILAYLFASRQLKELKQLLSPAAVSVFLLITLPWYLYMYTAHGHEFVYTFLGLHNFLRATVSEHPKDNYFYYYLILFPVSLLPWTGIFIREVFTKGATVNERNPHRLFLLLWPAVIIAFFTAMATKYPTYVFPALFPAALLTGWQLDKMLSSAKRKEWLWLTVPALALFATFAAGGKLLKVTADVRLLYIVAATSILAILWYQIKGRIQALPIVVILSVAITGLTLIASAVIPYTDLRSAKALSASLTQDDIVVGAVGDYPTSAVFYSGKLVTRLVNDPAQLEIQGVWAGKYTMPMETLDDFQKRTSHNKEVYLIVNQHGSDKGTVKLSDKGFAPVFDHGYATLYKKASGI